MSPFGKIFGKKKNNSETEEDLSGDEEELPQAFQLEPPAANPEPTGEATSEEQADPLLGDEGASTGAEEEQKQEENSESKEGDLMGLFGTTAHGGQELEALSSDIEDVSVQELLADLQSIATALRGGSAPAGEGRREEAA